MAHGESLRLRAIQPPAPRVVWPSSTAGTFRHSHHDMATHDIFTRKPLSRRQKRAFKKARRSAGVREAIG